MTDPYFNSKNIRPSQPTDNALPRTQRDAKKQGDDPI
jgi:hypothetical protein